MEKVKLGSLWHVSRLTISAAGITSLWGETPKEEGWATLTEAFASGIDHIDTAPAYRNGEAEEFLGEYFAEGWPADIRVTTKVGLGTVSPDDVRSNLRESIVRSLQRMNRRDVDLFLLHSHLVPDEWDYPHDTARKVKSTTPMSLFQGAVVPAMRDLVKEGLCDAWGITGIGPVEPVEVALAAAAEERPQAVQCIINAMESAGGLSFADPNQDAQRRRAVVHASGVGMLGIRLVQAGALTEAMDREPRGNDARDFHDYELAEGFRRLAAESGTMPSFLAYQYAFSDERVDSHVLGVKNRKELSECLRALEAGPLSDEEMASINSWRASAWRKL